ncbi:hypothetical protein M0R45_000716 [Rubus argutus]|uniref:Uncharacterized protein n=1 Tax=Rubus argutus TaxID=59490 RepID=A0AAW1VNP9_RUBAR
MSVEAFAMAGMDYTKSGIDLEELEYDASEQPPPYLLAEQSLRFGVQNNTDGIIDTTTVAVEEEMKARMRAWAKAVASMNDIVCISMKCSSTNVFR